MTAPTQDLAEVPRWARARVLLATVDGPVEVDGFTHPYVPGFAVTGTVNTMGFTCTHIQTGRRLGVTSAVAVRCCVWLLEYALVCEQLAVTPADHTRVLEAMQTLGKVTSVPFDEHTITEHGQSRLMSCHEWMQFARDPFGDPEYIAFGDLDLREQKLMGQLQERIAARGES